jgi:hypothetical protein
VTFVLPRLHTPGRGSAGQQPRWRRLRRAICPATICDLPAAAAPSSATGATSGGATTALDDLDDLTGDDAVLISKPVPFLPDNEAADVAAEVRLFVGNRC